jgi:hypothetical protein
MTNLAPYYKKMGRLPWLLGLATDMHQALPLPHTVHVEFEPTLWCPRCGLHCLDLEFLTAHVVLAGPGHAAACLRTWGLA